MEAAPEDFAELEAMEKMKAISSSTKTGKSMKDVCQSLPEAAKQVKADAEAMKEALEAIKKLIEEGTLKAKGDECSAANLMEARECYEKVYEPIPKASKKAGGKGGDGGCCTIF